MQGSPIYITKADGQRSVFSQDKLRLSLTQAGANEETINAIVRQLQDQVYEGIPTKKIYRLAFDLLKKRSRPIAARYKLKQAIMELGPSGFPFEKFVGELMRHQGYAVQVGVVLKGHTVNHEVDVLGDKDAFRVSVECKYGNKTNKKVSVQVPLYIKSRFEDLKKEWLKSPEHQSKKFQPWIVTNTHFSEDAKTYGMGNGIRLVSWDFPKKGSLKDWVESSQLYPITTLISLTRAEKKILLQQNYVLVRDVLSSSQVLEELRIPHARYRKAIQELEYLCGGNC